MQFIYYNFDNYIRELRNLQETKSNYAVIATEFVWVNSLWIYSLFLIPCFLANLSFFGLQQCPKIVSFVLFYDHFHCLDACMYQNIKWPSCHSIASQSANHQPVLTPHHTTPCWPQPSLTQPPASQASKPISQTGIPNRCEKQS